MSEEIKGKIEKKNDENLDKLAGGFSYNRSYSYNSGENYDNQYDSVSYELTEKERQTLRNAGCKFSLSDYGEINGVMDSSGNKLTPQKIAEFLGKK